MHTNVYPREWKTIRKQPQLSLQVMAHMLGKLTDCHGPVPTDGRILLSHYVTHVWCRNQQGLAWCIKEYNRTTSTKAS